MTRANWPQMEVVTSIEGEGMRWCCRSEAGFWQINGSGFSHQHQSCNICLLVSLWYCASLSGCSRSLPCSSCSVCMCGFKSVKCIYFSNAASYRVSLDAAVSPVCFQPINSERDSSEGTRDVSHVSKCQSAQPNGAEQ